MGSSRLHGPHETRGVSLWEMMDYARVRKVPAQYDLEDLKRDLGTIRRA